MGAGTSIHSIVCGFGVASLLLVATPSHLPATELGDDGLHKQDWFVDSFLDLKEDHTEAASRGKGLVVLFEQRGCPYCKELHQVNFAKTEIRDYLTKNFDVVQLDMWGSRPVTDFDGMEYEERALAQAWRVNFTPTMVFFSKDPATAKMAEVARLPGYFKPFHFLSMLEFVHEGKFAKQNFQRYLQDKFKRLSDEGKEATVW